jgi:GT2 family glycosyltransferase
MTTDLAPSRREESGSATVAAGLSVVISVHNDAEHLERCLRSLAPQRSELNEVIVVDDGSSDASGAVARAAGCEVIRLSSRRGLRAARNVGASRAAGEILVFIDADTTVRAGWAGGLRVAFANGASLAGGGIAWPEPHSLAERFQSGGYWHDETARNGFLPFVSGAHFAIRREVFLVLGGFDELPLSEDLDLSFRAQLAGYPVSFVPEAELVHWPRRSVRGLLSQRMRHARERRFADHKYRLFPFARMNRGGYSVTGAFVASAKRVLIAGTSADVGALSLPALRAAVTMARRLGVLRAELELLLGLQALPQPVRFKDHKQHNTASPLPGRPALLLVGDDRLVMKALRGGLTGSRRLTLGPSGLEREALERWDDPAPWSLRLARKAVREGWRLPLETTALRIEREHPRTWGEAFLTLHRVNAWAHERPYFALVAFGDPGWRLASKLPDVPIVVAGSHRACHSDRIVLQVSRAELLHQRREVLKTVTLVRDRAIERSHQRVGT